MNKENYGSIPYSQFGANKTSGILLKYNYQVKTGDILAGTVVGLEKKYTLVDGGLSQVSFLPEQEIMINFNSNLNLIFTVNKTGEFMILYSDQRLKQTILSFRKLHCRRLWERFKQVDFSNMILFSVIEKSLWRGKLVKFDGLKIYIPNTHLPKYYRRKNKLKKKLPLQILEIKDKTHTIVGSARLAFLKRQSLSLHLGSTQLACVLSVKSYGLFVNIYGIKCLLHISELFHQKIENINKLYKRGDQLNVKVVYLNTSQGKIAVSAKQV